MVASGKKSDVSKTWHRHNMFLTEAANRGSISTGYDIENSSVWEPDLADQAYRSQGSTAGTRTKQTFSVWLKRTE